MKFDQSPHPLVEDHYHIQELINAQEKRTKDRVQWQTEKKNQEAIDKYIAGFKDVELLDFYCGHCETDFVGRARKQIDSWGQVAYYKIKHRCGNWTTRLVTDKDKDPYFFRSKRLMVDRRTNELNMMQSWETGYNTVYGKH